MRKASEVDTSILGLFKARYMGSTAVRIPDDIAYLSKSIDPLRGRESAVKVFFIVRERDIKIVDRDTADVIQFAGSDQIAFHGFDPADKKILLFSVRTTATQQRLYCHAIEFKDSYAEVARAMQKSVAAAAAAAPANGLMGAAPPSRTLSRQQSTPSIVSAPPAMASALDEEDSFRNGGVRSQPSRRVSNGDVRERDELRAQLSQEAAQYPSGASGGAPPPAGTTLQRGFQQSVRRQSSGVLTYENVSQFFGFYIGKGLCRTLFGNEELLDALDRCTRQRRDSLGNPRSIGDPIVLILDTESIKMVDRETGAPIMTEYIKNISYSSVLERSHEKDTFGYIAVDRRLGSINCHLFYLAPGEAPRAYQAINNAFKLLAELDKYV